MEITIKNTEEIIDLAEPITRARKWRGTYKGKPVTVLVSAVLVEYGALSDEYKELMDELKNMGDLGVKNPDEMPMPHEIVNALMIEWQKKTNGMPITLSLPKLMFEIVAALNCERAGVNYINFIKNHESGKQYPHSN